MAGGRMRKPQLAAGKGFRLGIIIIDSAKNPVLALPGTQWLAIGPDGDVDVRSKKSAVAVRREFQLERGGQRATRSGRSLKLGQGVHQAFSKHVLDRTQVSCR